MVKVKINGIAYEATINGQMNDYQWDSRESKFITLEMSHNAALGAFQNGTHWSIVMTEQRPVIDAAGAPVLDADGAQVFEPIETEIDNSDYSIAGDVTDHRDGSVTVKMGKPTDLEDAYEMLYGGVV